ncbi:MAG: NAD(P)-dependent oxidoreductase [Nitrospirae bacterium]|nr:NAD(P)-dependent oxidoreductase [Nitrospirota bacterium]
MADKDMPLQAETCDDDLYCHPGVHCIDSGSGKVLLTGARGDIGSSLCKLYEKQKSVHNDGRGKKSAFRIIHLAVKAPPSGTDDMIASNIMFLDKVIRFARKERVDELVFFSAMAVYGKINQDNISEEAGFFNPSFYALTKLLGEEMLKDQPFKTICLRLPAILGLRNKTNLLYRLFEKFIGNETVCLTNAGKMFNNVISVDGLFRFIDNLSITKQHDIINIASKKDATLYDIAVLMKERLDSKSEIKTSCDTSSFFNISTLKAETSYGFIPDSTVGSVSMWLDAKIAGLREENNGKNV